MTTFALKLIAILTMLIDHTGAVLLGDLLILRIIGRIAFPIFAFLTAEACARTRDPEKRLIRLGVFALICELPFDWAFFYTLYYPGHQNVFFTLFLASLAIYAYERLQHRSWAMVAVLLLSLVGDLLHTDYGMLGILLIFALYRCRTGGQRAMAVTGMNLLFTLPAVAMMGLSLYTTQQMWGCLAIPFIWMYNSKLGPKMKYFFYLFYPLHLIILSILAQLWFPTA